MMNWADLLSTSRIGMDEDAPAGREESPFLLDLDRITFSSFFRRLQDKTQVHPLSVGGRVRSRLTHSVEVASVGRSLGFGVGRQLIEGGAIFRHIFRPMISVISFRSPVYPMISVIRLSAMPVNLQLVNGFRKTGMWCSVPK